MAVLTRDIKTYIVQALACFDSPSTVAKAVGEEFGVLVPRQQIEAHDPTKRCSKGLAKRWVFLFEATREGFLKAIADIPIANRAYRLRVLSRIYQEAERVGNLVLAMKVLELAAKECGNAYCRRVPSKGGRAAPGVAPPYFGSSRHAA